MLTAPARTRRPRLGGLITAGAVALSLGAATLGQPAAAATAISAAPRAPGAYALTYSFYETPSDGKSQWIEFYPNELDASGGVPVTGYVVRRSGGSPARDAGWTSSVLPASNSGLTLTYLKPATTYDAYVRAVNQYGQSPETRVTFRTASVPRRLLARGRHCSRVRSRSVGATLVTARPTAALRARDPGAM